MWKEARVYLAAIALLLVGMAVFAAIRFITNVHLLRNASRAPESSEVIRRPNLGVARMPDLPEQNIAPFATVTVSSVEESSGQPNNGVADGQVDAKEWVTHEEKEGAWIRLSWFRPAVISGVALYDLPDRLDNVLSGRLSFEDGSQIPVPTLPPAGAPWRITFPPKVVHWVMFRIDRAEGKTTGLEEFMVFGTLNP